MKLPIPESIIDELRDMVPAAAIVTAPNGETLSAEDALGLIALAQRPGPDLEVRDLVRAGLNGFAVEMLVESIRQFRDFEAFGPFRFSLRGVSLTLSYDPASDEAHKDRRARQDVPKDDPHWAKRSNGDLAAVPTADAAAAETRRIALALLGAALVVETWSTVGHEATAPTASARALDAVISKIGELSTEDRTLLANWARAAVERASDHDVVVPLEPTELLHRIGMISNREAVTRRGVTR
jgi:hypothetical protein